MIISLLIDNFLSIYKNSIHSYFCTLFVIRCFRSSRKNIWLFIYRFSKMYVKISFMPINKLLARFQSKIYNKEVIYWGYDLSEGFKFWLDILYLKYTAVHHFPQDIQTFSLSPLVS